MPPLLQLLLLLLLLPACPQYRKLLQMQMVPYPLGLRGPEGGPRRMPLQCRVWELRHQLLLVVVAVVVAVAGDAGCCR